MDYLNGSDRLRASEDEYFRRRDAELLAWSREADRASRERIELGEALGEPDTEAVNQLYAHGVRVSNAAVVEWLPAVEVAWMDGADEAERHALRTQFLGDEQASDDGVALLDGWVSQRPSEGFLQAGRRALRRRLQRLDDDEREATVARIVAICEAVGRAAGGTFGIGALSSGERRHIDVIRQELEQPI